MKVNSVVQLPNGIVKFKGELSEEEAGTVISTGLQVLIMAGAFPDITRALAEADQETPTLIEGNDTIN